MCLIAFAWQAHTDYPLVVIANRDEFYDRPTLNAHFWGDKPQIFGGRDLSAGGSWLAVSRNGRFAALTNYRDPQNNNPQAKSRGSLISDFLLNELSSEEYALGIRAHANDYNGFNLLLCDGHNMVYYNNQNHNIDLLDAGTYALSNALLDTPWPKTLSARAKLNNWLENPDGVENLLQLLNDPQTALDDQLPATGVSLELEKALSAQFIKLDHYGTRCTTAFIVDQSGDAEFVEQVYNPDAAHTVQRFKRFW